MEDFDNRPPDYERWFLREVEKGLESADRAEFVDHEEVGRMIENRYRG